MTTCLPPTPPWPDGSENPTRGEPFSRSVSCNLRLRCHVSQLKGTSVSILHASTYKCLLLNRTVLLSFVWNTSKYFHGHCVARLPACLGGPPVGSTRTWMCTHAVQGDTPVPCRCLNCLPPMQKEKAFLPSCRVTAGFGKKKVTALCSKWPAVQSSPCPVKI